MAALAAVRREFTNTAQILDQAFYSEKNARYTKCALESLTLISAVTSVATLILLTAPVSVPLLAAKITVGFAVAATLSAVAAAVAHVFIEKRLQQNLAAEVAEIKKQAADAESNGNKAIQLGLDLADFKAQVDQLQKFHAAEIRQLKEEQKLTQEKSELYLSKIAVLEEEVKANVAKTKEHTSWFKKKETPGTSPLASSSVVTPVDTHTSSSTEAVHPAAAVVVETQPAATESSPAVVTPTKKELKQKEAKEKAEAKQADAERKAKEKEDRKAAKKAEEEKLAEEKFKASEAKRLAKIDAKMKAKNEASNP